MSVSLFAALTSKVMSIRTGAVVHVKSFLLWHHRYRIPNPNPSRSRTFSRSRRHHHRHHHHRC